MKNISKDKTDIRKYFSEPNNIILNYVYSRRGGFIEYKVSENKIGQNQINIFLSKEDFPFVEKMVNSGKFRNLLKNSYLNGPNDDSKFKDMIERINISLSVVPNEITFEIDNEQIRRNLEMYLFCVEHEIENQNEPLFKRTLH